MSAGAPDASALRARRSAAQLLVAPLGGGPDAIVERLLAVQAQDARAVPLALRARGARALGELERELGPEGTLVVGWLGRGTLHLVRREDYPWLLGLTAPARRAANRRRLVQEGVDERAAQRAVLTVRRALESEGSLTRADLGERLARRRIRTEGQALVHLLVRAALDGALVLAAPASGAWTLAPARDWLGSAPPSELRGAERGRALERLTFRYLTGHGPASAADLAAWIGLPVRDARAGVAAAGAAIVELDGGGLLDLAGREQRADQPPPRLLPAFDPYLLGWRDRAFAVDPTHARRVHPGGGIVRAVATVGGRAVATWTARRRDERLTVELSPFAPLGRREGAALEEEAADVARFEGLELAGVSVAAGAPSARR